MNSRQQWKAIQFEQAQSNGLDRLLADFGVGNSSLQAAWRSQPDVSDVKSFRSNITGPHLILRIRQKQLHALPSQPPKLCLLKHGKKRHKSTSAFSPKAHMLFPSRIGPPSVLVLNRRPVTRRIDRRRRSTSPPAPPMVRIETEPMTRSPRLDSRHRVTEMTASPQPFRHNGSS